MGRLSFATVVLAVFEANCGRSPTPPVTPALSPSLDRAIETASIDPTSMEGPNHVGLQVRFELELDRPPRQVRFVDLSTLPWECWPAIELPPASELIVLRVATDIDVGEVGPVDGRPASLMSVLSSAGVEERAAAEELASGWGWAGAAGVAGSAQMIAVLDWKVEDPGWEVVVLSSADGGRTWSEMSRVRKPHYLARVDSVSLEANGSGLLDLHLDDCADCGTPLGHYVHATADGGRTWTLSHDP
jgi:hypothetical protein